MSDDTWKQRLDEINRSTEAFIAQHAEYKKAIDVATMLDVLRGTADAATFVAVLCVTWGGNWHALVWATGAMVCLHFVLGAVIYHAWQKPTLARIKAIGKEKAE